MPASARESAERTPYFAAAGHVPALDGLRFFSFLGVFIWHAWQNNRTLSAFAHYGALGVQVFFVLSGFLIGGILLQVREQHGTPLSRRLWIFYVRRALRIFPLYYLALLTAEVLPALGVTALGGHHLLVWNAAYLSNVKLYLDQESGGLAHFWSLSVEEHFYIVAPVAVLMLTTRRLARCCVAIWLLCAASRLSFALHGSESAEVLSPFQFDCLTVGVAAAILEAEGTFLGLDRRHLFRLSTACAAALLPLFLLRHADSRLTVAVAHMIEQWVFAVACAGLIVAVWSSPDSRLSRLLAFAPLRRLGEVTYGLYVFHLPCLVLVSTWLSPYLHHGSSLPSLAVTIALSLVSFRFFESPINALKRRFPYGMRPAAQAAGGAARAR
jgi:peptidoglycan/LPS O-acetylase OafA/YrhL